LIPVIIYQSIAGLGVMVVVSSEMAEELMKSIDWYNAVDSGIPSFSPISIASLAKQIG
jgi:hypothetical protein